MADTSASEPAPAATQQQQQVATEAVHADTEQTAKTETAEVKHGARKGGKKESKEDGDASKPAHFEDSDGLFKLVCRTFMKHKCKRSPCKNVHDPRLCPEYWKSGECKYGVECRRNHFVTLPTAQDAGDASADAKPAKAKKEKKAKKPSEAASAAQAAVDEYGDSTTDSKKKSKKPKKKNTEVWDPMTKPVDLRITYDLGSKNDTFTTPLATRDVVLVPNLFSDYKTGELYTKLVTELEGCGIPRDNLLKMWHGNDKIDGTHLIVDDRSSWKKKCPTFDLVTDRIKKFFKLSIQATRFNWYLDTSQWKPFHFDAAAVKPEIAAKQNFTVAISFGATRDAAFEHAQSKTTVSMPQPDGCAYAFARDTNVIWRHGILQDVPVRKEGRISVIAWGWVDGMEETEAVIPTAPVLDQKTNGTKGETKKSETGGAAERKPKKKKDKNAPKRAASAFFIFSKSMRETVKSEKPELEFPQVSAEIKDRWNALSEEERKPYEEKAAADKVRYSTEMESYKASGASEKVKPNSVKKKDPLAPKRAHSAYVFFCLEARESVQAENPDAKFAEIGALLNAKYHALSDVDRAKYLKLHEDDVARYKSEMDAYRSSKKSVEQGEEKDGSESKQEEKEEGRPSE